MQLSTFSPTEQALLSKAEWLAGFTLGEIAEMLHIPIPADLKRDKGWVGTLIETALGAKAGSKAEQDFAHLGIELKTIPVNQKGLPLETTFVSLAPLTQNNGIIWETSHVKHKLSRVLWIRLKGNERYPCRTPYRSADFMVSDYHTRIPPTARLGGINGVDCVR